MAKRAFGFSGGCETDDHHLVVMHDYRYLCGVTRGTIPRVRFTLIHNGSFSNTAYWLIKKGPAELLTRPRLATGV